MGKYDNSFNDRTSVQLKNIANELAEANRLKRLELNWFTTVNNDDIQLKEIEDEA